MAVRTELVHCKHLQRQHLPHALCSGY